MKKKTYILAILYFVFGLATNVIHPITADYVRSLNLNDTYFTVEDIKVKEETIEDSELNENILEEQLNSDKEILKIAINKLKTILKNYTLKVIYEENNNQYHGIIDLILEHADHIDIIDYKLNQVVDDAYKKQLEGYKNYISTLTNKKINTNKET